MSEYKIPLFWENPNLNSSKSFTQFFFEKRQQAKTAAERERRTFLNPDREIAAQFPWGTFFSDLQEYSDTFRDLLIDAPGTAAHGFARWIQERQRTHPESNIHTLDFMGQGGFSYDHESGRTIHKEAAITLVDFMTNSKSKDKITTVANDVLQGNTWRQIDDFLRENNTPGFDLIICRPIAGWDVIYNNAPSREYRKQISLILLRRLIDTLHPDGGTLFAKNSDESFYDALQQILSSTPKLMHDFRRENGIIKVVRNTDQKTRYKK